MGSLRIDGFIILAGGKISTLEWMDLWKTRLSNL